MKQFPLLFVSDNPSGFGGLARIGRDLAALAATMPEFRVGYAGRGPGMRRKLPFTLYPFGEEQGFGEGVLEEIWRDFSPEGEGAIFTLDDANNPTSRS